MKNSVISYS